MIVDCTYVSNKMEHFSYQGGSGVCILRHLKEELAWAADTGLHVFMLSKELYQYGTKQ